MDDQLTFAVKLIRQAGDLLRAYYNPAGIQATTKSDRTIVTAADLAADKMITSTIHQQYPENEIISEESSLSLHTDQKPVWIVDPLDGTTNFSLGLPIWGVSIAYVIHGKPELGIVYFPMLNELYTARRGHGAFLNNKPVSVRAPDPAQPMSFFACCSRTFRNYNVSIPYKSRILGSCTYSFCMVARGAALLGFDATPKIWDIAAIWVLVEEAGGKIAAFENSAPFPITMQDNFNSVSYPTLASATPEVFSMGLQKIRRKS
jgi:myo-inositol-1(or 4)-monophosphatase